MYDLEKMFKTQSKFIILLILIYAILAFVTPFHEQFTGLLVGTAGSLFSLWWMVRKSKIFRKKFAPNKRTFTSLGVLQRFATVAALSFFALKNPSIVSIDFLLLGIATMYIVIKIDYGTFLFKRYSIKGVARK
ncbi:MAG: synthase [Bacillales bacterium]|nr:synthase [Bacillales bacterium]